MFRTSAGGGEQPDAVWELIVCGWDEVFIVDLSKDTDSPNKVWRWKAKDGPELPAHVKGRFGTTDDCKPVNDGKHVLITSSGGGVNAWWSDTIHLLKPNRIL